MGYINLEKVAEYNNVASYVCYDCCYCITFLEVVHSMVIILDYCIFDIPIYNYYIFSNLMRLQHSYDLSVMDCLL